MAGIPSPPALDQPAQLFSSLLYSRALLTQDENTRICGGQPAPLYMLVYHRDRILQAARNFTWHAAIDALQQPECISQLREKCQQAVDDALAMSDSSSVQSGEQAFRLRILITRTACITVQAVRIPAISVAGLFPSFLPPPPPPSPPPSDATATTTPAWSVHLDTQATPPSSLTRYKTTSRDHYDDARARVGITAFAEPREVLLWSPDGWVMEGSITNVYFWRAERGGWITPSTPQDGGADGDDAGGMGGTVRRWLLEKGIVTVGDVRKEEVRDGEAVWLSNGVKGVVFGRIVAANARREGA
ncbi:hypothetical protein DRE_01763 [Drechslerella stenobrocha 248]|uniref:Aminodeoxychorismate lyase n=1 Tax=Drechslerella stenobrocha 248 TaxID=1043628 RepID=W7HWL4_9PEZI|nr:hypothetical protein DRE_01763 [Drechslerella stenobrocha 248]